MKGFGPGGKTCKEGIQEAIGNLKIASADEIFDWVKQKYPGIWTDDHIWQDIMASVVNLRPAHEHWTIEIGSLFLHEDGRYELYDSQIHGKWKKGERVR